MSQDQSSENNDLRTYDNRYRGAPNKSAVENTEREALMAELHALTSEIHEFHADADLDELVPGYFFRASHIQMIEPLDHAVRLHLQSMHAPNTYTVDINIPTPVPEAPTPPNGHPIEYARYLNKLRALLLENRRRTLHQLEAKREDIMRRLSPSGDHFIGSFRPASLRAGIYAGAFSGDPDACGLRAAADPEPVSTDGDAPLEP